MARPAPVGNNLGQGSESFQETIKNNGKGINPRNKGAFFAIGFGEPGANLTRGARIESLFLETKPRGNSAKSGEASARSPQKEEEKEQQNNPNKTDKEAKTYQNK